MWKILKKEIKINKMSGVNKVIIVGNLGQDPNTRVLENGNTVTNFSVATSERYKDAGGEYKEQTEWHNVVIWGKTAEVADKYLKKGSKAYFEGKLKTRSWEKDGVTRYATEIVVNNMVMLSSKQEQPAIKNNPSSESDEDLPF